MSGAVGHLVVGFETHGVVRYAMAVHDALVARGMPCSLAVAAPTGPVPSSLAECSLVHIHVTDRLFGADPGEALQNLRLLAESIGGPMSLTLHDIPQPSDGAVMPRRADFYRGAIASADGVIVSSEHEARLLREFVDPGANPEVVPLMIDAPRGDADPPAVPTNTVGILGFLYPGKGHIDTVNAMVDLPPAVKIVALGTASPGHEDLVDELRAVASNQGRNFEITGFLDDDELHRRMREITVPVAYHRHMSASGSINTWISARRRPLVPRSDYVVELERRSPGVVCVHDDNEDALRDAIVAGLTNPLETWIDQEVRPVPSPGDVAEAYSALYRRWCA